METQLALAADQVLAHWTNQVSGTFASRSSTLSIGALGCTLAVAVLCVAPRGRRIRPKVFLRALFPRWLFASRTGRADAGYFIFSLFFSGAAFGWALLSTDAIRPVFAEFLNALAGNGPQFPVNTFTLASVTVGAFITYEFAYWIDHLISHKVKFFWRFHAVHHSAERLSLLTNFRVHPIETVKFYNIVAVALGAFYGLAEWACDGEAKPLAIGETNLLLLLTAVFITHLQHSHFWVTFGCLGNWVLGAAHHQIHHSASPEHFDKNFGSTLAIWDRLFGTFTLPSKTRMMLRFGINDPAVDPHSLRGTILGPLRLRPGHPPRSNGSD